MVKQSTREARERVDALLATSADDPAVVELDARVKKLEAPFEADARERVEAQKAKEEKLAAEKKAAEEAEAAKAAKNAALAHKAELPWVMAKEDRDAIAKYIDELGRVTNSKQVGDFKKALEARAEEDRQIVEAKGNEADKAKEELDLYELFLDQLGYQTLVGYFDGDVDLAKNIVNFKQLRIRTTNSSVYLRTCPEDGKLYFGTFNQTAPGALYMYDVPECRATYMNMACCDRGEFTNYSGMPQGKMGEVNHCQLDFASLGPQEGVYALTAVGNKLYGITKPGGFFFIYNTETGELRSHDIFRTLIQEQNNLSKILFTYEGGIYFSAHHGYIIRYDIASDAFQETGLKIPCGAGREYLNCLDALVSAGDGLFYGGTHGDGYIFRLNLKENTLVNLGKPTGEGQIRAMTLGRDGVIWGIAGRDKDLSHLFAYQPETGDISDMGIMRAKIPNTWIIHRADAMLTGLDGELYIGEHDDISHLVTYFPPVGK